MDFKEYIDGANDYYENWTLALRKGQAYFNYLNSREPRIANLIQAMAMGGENVDPFYDDRNIPMFLKVVYDELHSFDQ